MKWVTRRKARVDRIACADVPGVGPRYRRRARSRRGHLALQFPVYDALYTDCRTGHA